MRRLFAILEGSREMTRRPLNARAAMARAMTEDELLSAITEAATFLGWRWMHVRRSDLAIIQGHVGFPDVVLAKSGRILFLELKRQDGQTTPAQDEWIAALTGSQDRALTGADGYVDALVVRPDQLDAILQELAR
jgi:hypothetical protein